MHLPPLHVESSTHEAPMGTTGGGGGVVVELALGSGVAPLLSSPLPDDEHATDTAKSAPRPMTNAPVRRDTGMLVSVRGFRAPATSQ
jgi:hypothetical protein